MPPLLITPGEPAGIGPDVVISALCARTAPEAPPLIVADPALLAERARLLGLAVSIHECAPADMPERDERCDRLHVWPTRLRVPAQPGRLDPANADYVLETLRRATDACLQGAATGMVTGPVQKSVIMEAGHAFSGHTEFLAERCGGVRPVMMLVAPDARPLPLRVALATTHLPLRAVADSLSQAMLEDILRILDHDLRRDFGISQPRIKVTGLNPHAGESGHIGREELDLIAPAIAASAASGIDANGPWPADTLFTPDHLADCDAVLAMFHDQGLPTLKYAGFGTAVNVTLGLPIMRVSVDHGTALDVAGSGRARDSSLRAALALAETLRRQRAAD